jgi:hypothetical protein
MCAQRGLPAALKKRAITSSFTRPPPSPESARITNAIEGPHEEFKRCVKTQTALPPADTIAMLFWGLIASDCHAQGRRDGKRSQTYRSVA